MNKEQAKTKVEEMIEYHMSEFDLEKEDAINVVAENLMWEYRYNKISKEDMLLCFDVLKIVPDLDYIERGKAQYEKSKAYRNNRKKH